MDDLFATQLQECSWRGVSFPIEMVSEKGGQRLAIHYRMDRDGAQVEATGRMPYQFTVRAYFLEGLTPGSNESWADLYPQGWLAVKGYLERRDTGTFVHPLYGNITCKPVTWQADFNSEIRSGVIVNMEFIETIDDSNSTTNLAPSVVSGTTASAGNLDNAMIGLSIPDQDMLGYDSYADANAGIISSGPLQGLALISKMTNGLLNVADEVFDLDDSYASLLDNIYQYVDSLNSLALEFQLEDKDTSIHTTVFDTTLASVAGEVGNTIDDIISLNPSLVSYAILMSGTQVAYYNS